MLDTPPTTRILITTYTIENLEQIRLRLVGAAGGSVPPNVTLMSWFTFLLRDCIKPYQNFLTHTNRVKSLNFEVWNNERRRPKTDIDGYYFDSGSNLRVRNAADFAVAINERSGGKPVSRLEELYDHIYIDEVQDLAGYDLELLISLFVSAIRVTMVGDPRQCIYLTSLTSRHKQYRELGMFKWFEEQEKRSRLQITNRNISYRCNQHICDFADALYPELSEYKTVSGNHRVTDHDGVFCIRESQIDSYIEMFDPVRLQYQKSEKTAKYGAVNIGLSKGSTYDRVLIFPTKKMEKYLRTGNVSDAGDRAKLYVAVTRARSSVAFVTETVGWLRRWENPASLDMFLPLFEGEQTSSV
ncbi:UvrD-helicase domain-containing protein [Nocardia abscessus]|uniref:UvrD-helicase domain-containing protein n=1 Tax=Nocardia abscessus TaxID=120957 RepID=UPI002B4B5692|nr:UvrD-helicase domain-containing protein [Nocardia abscessus]